MKTEVMTVSEVAEYLRLNPQTVYRKAKTGELPAVRIGRAIRFRRAELDAWLKAVSVAAHLQESGLELEGSR
jgi:excisionase family DNA binding protein